MFVPLRGTNISDKIDFFQYISNQGLGYLKTLSALQTLDLSETTISDQGLSQLAALTNLRILYLK